MENPCRYCVDDRTITCHATCEKYIEYTEKNNERKDLIYSNKQKDNILFKCAIEHSMKAKRR